MDDRDSYLWLENIEEPVVVKWALERDSKTRENFTGFRRNSNHEFLSTSHYLGFFPLNVRARVASSLKGRQ
ncbi:MAG: hypothetical protein QXY49_05950 [Thermofilaceae archaeon]